MHLLLYFAQYKHVDFEKLSFDMKMAIRCDYEPYVHGVPDFQKLNVLRECGGIFKDWLFGM